MTISELNQITRAIRTLDCGVHFCRYCPAQSASGWQHDEHCPYASSVRDAEEARRILDRWRSPVGGASVSSERQEPQETCPKCGQEAWMPGACSSCEFTDRVRAAAGRPLRPVSGGIERGEEKDSCAGLIGHAIPDVAETEPRLNGWQLFGTHPKDGRWLLGWHHDFGHFVFRDGPGLVTGEDPMPTHWMALPPSPASGAESETPQIGQVSMRSDCMTLWDEYDAIVSAIAVKGVTERGENIEGWLAERRAVADGFRARIVLDAVGQSLQVGSGNQASTASLAPNEQERSAIPILSQGGSRSVAEARRQAVCPHGSGAGHGYTASGDGTARRYCEVCGLTWSVGADPQKITIDAFAAAVRAEQQAEIERLREMLSLQAANDGMSIATLKARAANAERERDQWQGRYMELVKSNSTDYHDQLSAAHTTTALHEETDQLKAQLGKAERERDALKAQIEQLTARASAD